MLSNHALFLLPYLLGLALSLGIVAYVRKYGGNPAARFFSYKVVAESLIIAAFILETVSPTLSEKILWDDVQYVLDLALPGLGYLFVLSIARREIRGPVAYPLLLVPPVAGAALMATDSLHHLIRPSAVLNTGPLFAELLYPLTTVQWALLSFIILFFLANPAILIAFIMRTRGALRSQALVVAVALLIPFAGSILVLAGIQIGPYRDMSPAMFTLQDLVILLALTRFALFDLVPIARDLAIDHINTSFFVEDTRHRIVDINRAGCDLLGLPPREVIGRQVEEIFPDHRDLLKRLRDADDAVVEVAARRPRNAGRMLELHLSTARDRWGRKMGRLFLLQDITTHKELAEDLRKTRDQLAARLAELEQAQAALLRRERLSTLGQTVATVSHEMRNPLATVRNALFSLREALGTGDRARSARAIELAERNIRRCDAIIMELVEYSRSRPPVLEDTDVDHWLGQVLDELDTPKGIEVTRTLCSRVRTRMDPERMRRAVINIHANAVQAMSTEDARGGTLAVESSSHDGKVEMAFRDNGTGMSSEVLAKAGEPLYSTKPYGVGLGLSIVKEVMREHGGSLRIDSSEGKGTVVTLELRALP